MKPFPFDKDGQKKFYEIYNQFSNEGGDLVMDQIPSKKRMNHEKIKLILNKCNTSEFNFQGHQNMVRDFLSPYSGYKGILLCHEPGTGKTLAAINIAEQYMDQIKQYNTKIMVLVPNRGTKTNFIDEIVKYRTNSINTFMKRKKYDKKSLNKLKKEIKDQYQFMTQDSFRNIVIGTRQRVETADGKKVYFINSKGNEERRRNNKRMDFIKNTILIIDEAHNMTNDNEIKKAITKIINNPETENLKIILLTATPMKNTVLDIVPLMNFILPKSKRLDKRMIVSNINAAVDKYKLAEGWYEKLRENIGNHISYIKTNSDTFPDIEFMGTKIADIDLFNIFSCEMSPLQIQGYNRIQKRAKDNKDKTANAFSKNLQAIQMFCFPIFRNNRINFTYKMQNMINNYIEEVQKNNKTNQFNKALENTIGIKIPDNFIEVETFQDKEIIGGTILELRYLKYFSTKYYEALKNILLPININYKGFVYSDRVDIGVNLFGNILKHNGFIEYNKSIYLDSGDYNQVTFADIRCYKCGVLLKNHENNKKKDKHKFHPSTFIILTGTNDQDNENEILLATFNKKDNTFGEKIKLVLASRVMKEGRSLKNTCHEHILEAQYTVTAIQQIIGRARRHCSHVDLTNYGNPLPLVRVYLYATKFNPKSNKGGYTNDEDMYIKASRKHKSISIVMDCLRDISFDCAIQYDRNSIIRKCASNDLNKKYWDKENKRYKQLTNEDKKNYKISNENDLVKYCHQIQQYFFERSISGVIYTTMNDLEDYFIKIFKENKKLKSFNKSILYKSLNKYIPKSKNELYVLKYWLYDSELNEGYLIQKRVPNLNKELLTIYIFQPYNQSEKISIDERLGSQQKMIYQPSYPIDEIIKRMDYEEYQKIESVSENFVFDDKYFSKKNENIVLGKIVKDMINYENLWGVFKMRKGVSNDSNIKNNIKNGIQNKDGQHYFTKTLEQLEKYAKLINLKVNNYDKRMIGNEILNLLILYEQRGYGSSKNSASAINNILYLQIPKNHPIFPFPLNLFDRLLVIKSLQKEYKNNVKIKKSGSNIYRITIINPNEEINTTLKQIKAKLISNSMKKTIYEVDVNIKKYNFKV